MPRSARWLLAKDRDKVVPLLKNKVLAAVADILPDTTAAKIHRGMSKPGSAA